MRLDKRLSHMGLGSRSEVRDMIRAGRVRLNGEVCRDPAANAEDGTVSLDGTPVGVPSAFYLMLHKPAGLLTAAEDSRSRTVMELLERKYVSAGCMPVGRLDKDTTGLLLFTTDGELAHRLISPKRHVAKVYLAKTSEPVTDADVRAFHDGIRFKDFTALPAELIPLEEKKARVTVFEGKYHQVKRMFIARGNQVTDLCRLSFGPLRLDEALQPGQYRELTEDEIQALYGTAEMERKA